MDTLGSPQRLACQPLFHDQDKVEEPQEPRVFPERLAANITPPVWNQVLGSSVTPRYFFGWRMQPNEISTKYKKKIGRYLGPVDIWFELGVEWAETYPQYSATAPEFTFTAFDGYIISISDNNTRERIGRTRDEEFVCTMTTFLEMQDSEPAQWIRL